MPTQNSGLGYGGAWVSFTSCTGHLPGHATVDTAEQETTYGEVTFSASVAGHFEAEAEEILQWCI